MKRYLQAGAIVFFFLAGTWFFYGPEARTETPQTPARTTDADAILAADAAEYSAGRTQAPNDGPPPLGVSSALMKDTAGDRILYELNTDQHWPLASLTKLMNAVIALENIPQTEERNALIRRMMIISDNAAADALAAILGTEEYVALMNAKAQTLNMRQTGFSDPSGLSYLNQSTVKDIDKLVTYIFIRHPEIFAWSRNRTVRTPSGERPNINEFAADPTFVGGKTGWTDEANGNLVTLFSTPSGPVTVITLGSPTREDRFTETRTLFSWATQHFKLYGY